MTDVVMPQMGESIVEGTLTKWLKKPGDHVERDEPLFEISTDKVDTEIPSPAAGTLAEVLIEEGKTVAINTVVARIDEAGSAAAEPKPAAAAPPAAAEPSALHTEALTAAQVAAEKALAPLSPPVPEQPSGPLSPLVRRMARENSVDLAQVKGTGAGGRITKQDVEAYLARRAAPAPAAPAPPPAQAAPPSALRAVPAPGPGMPPVAGAPKTRIEPMSTMRAKIAEHMIMSRRTSAHVTTVHKVDMTRVVKMRERHKADFQARYGFGLTYLPFVARGICEGLRAFPLLNASIEGNNIIYHNEINIGIAVALDNGLIVPVIRNADARPVAPAQAGGSAGRHVLDHQFRGLRKRHRYPGDQSTPGRDYGCRRH